jgi:hypothetical protein
VITNCWSYAATGLTLACAGLLSWQLTLFTFHIPRRLQSPAGIYLLANVGLALAILATFFGYRVFLDNGLWGAPQLLLSLFAAHHLVALAGTRVGVAPLVYAALGAALAAWIY